MADKERSALEKLLAASPGMEVLVFLQSIRGRSEILCLSVTLRTL